MSVKIVMHTKIYNELKTLITNGHLKENDKLLTEEQLCEQYNVSRITIRRALKDLEEEGLIYKIRGKGTFISPSVIVQNKNTLTKFYDDIKKNGKIPSSKILSLKIIYSDEELNKKMSLKRSIELYEIIWIRYIDKEPVIYEKLYYPVYKFSGLEKYLEENINLYEVLQKKYKFTAGKGIEFFKPCLLSEEEIKLLKGNKIKIGMKLEKKLYDGEEVIEYTLATIRGDRFLYQIEYKL
ncbi:MAG: GntR family transcriptional regulator [Cetobacterium sp.]|uniref:GntR family transcriptional regulator n=1 Tax=Cetobacterium sp. TaxID=2071632 RepID=UPI003F36D4C3